jgi:hypothetical protein
LGKEGTFQQLAGSVMPKSRRVPFTEEDDRILAETMPTLSLSNAFIVLLDPYYVCSSAITETGAFAAVAYELVSLSRQALSSVYHDFVSKSIHNVCRFSELPLPAVTILLILISSMHVSKSNVRLWSAYFGPSSLIQCMLFVMTASHTSFSDPLPLAHAQDPVSGPNPHAITKFVLSDDYNRIRQVANPTKLIKSSA